MSIQPFLYSWAWIIIEFTTTITITLTMFEYFRVPLYMLNLLKS